MNIRRLQAAAESDERITYYVAQVSNLHGMTMQDAYQVQVGSKGSKVDAIIPLIPGVPLLITKNVSKPLRTMPLSHVTNKLIGLVNGNIVTFYGFADSDSNVQTGRIISAPAYMLVRVPDSKVKIGDFPVGVVPLERSKISFQGPRNSMGATYQQFGVTLAYVITDYKCQGETYYDGLLTDLQRPLIGNTEAASLYVQLSRVQSLQQLSIMRDFDPDELREPISDDLNRELEWEEDMDETTAEKYSYME
jgi:hypothetical protein